MSGTKGFGQIPDLNFKTLCCKNRMIIDTDCNLKVESAKTNDLFVRGDLTIKGSIQTPGKLVLGNTVINGTISSIEDEFTRMKTFSGNGNVTIEPISSPLTFNPTTLQIINCPCSGNIVSVNPMTGNVVYCPNGEPVRMDVYQYCIEDSCGVDHLVTQLLCQTF